MIGEKDHFFALVLSDWLERPVFAPVKWLVRKTGFFAPVN